MDELFEMLGVGELGEDAQLFGAAQAPVLGQVLHAALDPQLGVDVAARQAHRHRHLAAGGAGDRSQRQAGEVVLRIGVLLHSLGIQGLPEVAVAV